MSYDSLERALDERVASIFGEEAGLPLVYLLSAASPTDPSRKSLVEYLTTGDWPALPSSGMASWNGILENLGEDCEYVREDEERGEGQQNGSIISLKDPRNRSRGSLLSVRGAAPDRRQWVSRSGSGAGRTSSLVRGKRGLIDSRGVHQSRENLQKIADGASRAISADSQLDLEVSRVNIGASQADLGSSRVSLRGRPRRSLFQSRSASRERAGSVESVGAARGKGGGQRRGGILGGRSRSRSRGRLVQSRADLTQGTEGGAEESSSAGGGGFGLGRVRQGRARAKSLQDFEERGQGEERQTRSRRETGSLPRKREPIRRSQSSWSVR